MTRYKLIQGPIGRHRPLLVDMIEIHLAVQPSSMRWKLNLSRTLGNIHKIQFGWLQKADLHEESFILLLTAIVWWRHYSWVFTIPVISSCILVGTYTHKGQWDEPPRVSGAFLVCWRCLETEVVYLADSYCCSDKRAAANWRSVYAVNSCAYWYRSFSWERDIWTEAHSREPHEREFKSLSIYPVWSSIAHYGGNHKRQSHGDQWRCINNISIAFCSKRLFYIQHFLPTPTPPPILHLVLHAHPMTDHDRFFQSQ